MNKAPNLFDRQAVAANLMRRKTHELDFISELVLNDLRQRLDTLSRSFEKALILAPDATHLPKTMATHAGTIQLDRRSTLVNSPGSAHVDLAQLSTLDQNYDLVVSLFDLTITDDVPDLLVNLRQRLRPDGLFISGFIGGNSLHELRTSWLHADAIHIDGAAARIAPFIDTYDAAALLQRTKFALPVADIETHTIRYASPLALMKELKALGAANPLAQKANKLVTASHLAAACQQYSKIATDDDGRCRATMEIVWLSGWASHESQQKPLKPGSAQISLTEVLGTQKSPPKPKND